MPNPLTEAEKRLFEELRRGSKFDPRALSSLTGMLLAGRLPDGTYTTAGPGASERSSRVAARRWCTKSAMTSTACAKTGSTTSSARCRIRRRVRCRASSGTSTRPRLRATSGAAHARGGALAHGRRHLRHLQQLRRRRRLRAAARQSRRRALHPVPDVVREDPLAASSAPRFNSGSSPRKYGKPHFLRLRVAWK